MSSRRLTRSSSARDKRAKLQRLVDEIRMHSRSISFSSLRGCLEAAFPDADLHWQRGDIALSLVCPTQPVLEVKKHRLVEMLFRSAEDFANLNEQFFQDHPMTVLHLRDGRYAILDGHHRIRRYADLFGPDARLRLNVLSTRSFEMIANYRGQVEAVRDRTGSFHVKDLPIT